MAKIKLEQIEDLPISGGGSFQAGWTYKNTVTAADPGSGNFRMNNLTYGSITQLYYNDVSDGGLDLSILFADLIIGDQIYIQVDVDSGKSILFTIDGDPVDNTGWWTIPVSYESDSGTALDNNKRCVHSFVFEGDHIKHNLTATTYPGTGDDVNDGYSVGSIWLHTTDRALFVCDDNTAGAAKWRLISSELHTLIPGGACIPDDSGCIATTKVYATSNITKDTMEMDAIADCSFEFEFYWQDWMEANSGKFYLYVRWEGGATKVEFDVSVYRFDNATNATTVTADTATLATGAGTVNLVNNDDKILVSTTSSPNIGDVMIGRITLDSSESTVTTNIFVWSVMLKTD